MYKVQRDTQEKHALITQNFLLWALNMQILCGSFGYRKGGKRNCPCPWWSCRRLCSPQVAVGIEVLSLRRTGRESSRGTSLPWASPQSLGVWIHDQRFVEKLQLYAVFLVSRSDRAGRAEPQWCWARLIGGTQTPAPELCDKARQSSTSWQPEMPYCSWWWMNKQMSGPPQVPFFKVTFIFLLTSKSLEHIFPTATRTFVSFLSIFSHFPWWPWWLELDVLFCQILCCIENVIWCFWNHWWNKASRLHQGWFAAWDFLRMWERQLASSPSCFWHLPAAVVRKSGCTEACAGQAGVINVVNASYMSMTAE